MVSGHGAEVVPRPQESHLIRSIIDSTTGFILGQASRGPPSWFGNA
jgi:hypothetical protein